MRKFIVSGYVAYAEQDNFNNGCYGSTFADFVEGREFTRKNDTLDGLIADLCKEFRADLNAALLDSCGEPGRLDIQVIQREKFAAHRISENTMAEFRAGKRDLWATTYTFQVELIETEFALVDHVASMKLYAGE